MRTRVSNLAGTVSLLSLAAVLLLWARSHAGETMFVESTHGQLMFIGVDGPAGDLLKARETRPLDEFVKGLRRTRARGMAPATPEYGRLGFLLSRGDGGYVMVPQSGGGFSERFYPFVIVGIPYWFLALLAAGPVSVWAVHALRQRTRRRAGRCLGCGYDLRASPGRCPECGAVPGPPHNPPLERTAAAV